MAWGLENLKIQGDHLGAKESSDLGENSVKENKIWIDLLLKSDFMELEVKCKGAVVKRKNEL
jgi:hypothetical protein